MKQVTAADCKAAGEAVKVCFGLHLHSATYVLSPKRVVRATKRHKYDGRDCRDEFVVTIGTPNYRERDKLAKDPKAKWITHMIFPAKRKRRKK